MNSDLVQQLLTHFEAVARVEQGVEYWLARDLQPLLGYDRWENFTAAIDRAKVACRHVGQPVTDHFRDLTKMVELGSGARRQVADVAMTRYACYLVAQNGDPRKDPIAFAQTYFAIQTRKQEIIEQRIAEVDRLRARERLTASEKDLSKIIFERVGDERSFGRIRSKGDQALFGGLTTQQMKERLCVPESRPLADFLPAITIKAKDFANEITNFNVRKDDLQTEPEITAEHVTNNSEVRAALGRRGIAPEALPAAEDVRKLERRVKADERRLPGESRLAVDGPQQADEAPPA